MRTVDERFAAKCGTPDENGCIPWLAGKLPKGYGFIRIGSRKVLTHRYAYERANGPIPTGMVVMHRCDNPNCVNPDHLSIGSQKDNVEDMVSKGRHAWKDGTPWQKLFVDREHIRACRLAGLTQQEIADRYGVCRSRISQILNEGVPQARLKSLTERGT